MKQVAIFVFFSLYVQSIFSQVIDRVEYFIDIDPGFGNGISIPTPQDSIITNFTFNAPISSLSPGLHSLFIRSRDANQNWSLTQNQYLYKFPPVLNNNILPAITKLEYFIDTDPGFGNGIDVPITNDSIISAFSFNAPISSLSPGLHSLFIRSRDANQNWSLTQNQYLYKFPPIVNTNILPAITKLEYFIDTDPGFGNGIDVPITNDSLITAFSFNAPISSLSPGLHSLFIRSRDANQNWSLTQNQYLYKFPPVVNNNILPTITKLEYFIDSDPGFGNGIDVPITNDSIITAFSFNATISSLSPGLHSLFIRSRDANQNWSLTKNQYLYKFPPVVNNNILPAITKLEYFIDTDPGFGNGIDVPIINDSIITAFSFNAPIASLSPGLHSLFIRSKDANQNWSLTQNQYLYKFPPVVNNNILPAITKLEYFIDTDPGFGNGIDVPIINDSIITAFSFNAPIASLSPGLHSLFIRSRDANQNWSLTQNQYLYKFPPVVNNNILPAITKLEYFIDTDPGFGNGIDVPITNDSLINNVIILIDTTGLTYGSHVLSVRSMDANGKWSLTKNNQFTRDNIRLFLQGYYSGSQTMNTTLMNQGVGFDPLITDTVIIELHHPTYPYALKESTQALLQTNGYVNCSFTKSTGSYYIVIKHRNTLETWSATPVQIGNFPITYNFTTAANKAYGNKQKLMSGGVWALYSGDINQDDNIDLLDVVITELGINNFLFGYYSTDLNGDGNVDILDFPILESNVNSFIFSSHP